MDQALLIPTWPNNENVLDVWPGFNTFPNLAAPSLWHAHWLEFKNNTEAIAGANRTPAYEKRPSQQGEWVSRRVAGRFLCMRRLPSGPIMKLSEWEQLEVGMSILWHPEPSASEQDQAKARASYLQGKGRGRFKTQQRADCTLWVSRVT